MKRRHFLSSAGAFAASGCLSSCSRHSGKATLTVFSWADYLGENAVRSFEAVQGCELVVDTFDSNEMMIAKLEAGATGYDLLVPSSYAVKALHRRGMLSELDHRLIPNATNMDPDYLRYALDPEMRVSVPYMMSPTCLAYLRSRLPDAVPSWSMFERREIRGRATLLDDMREVLGAALKHLGHSLNSVEPSELAAATEVAIDWKSRIARFENEQYKAGIASGEYHLVHGYAGDLMAAQMENRDIGIVVPEEGTSFSCDDFCIPRSSNNKPLAHAFINHMCDPRVAAENMQGIGYRAPNLPAYALLDEDFKSSPCLFPPQELFSRCESIGDLEDHLPLWTAAWEKVKNA